LSGPTEKQPLMEILDYIPGVESSWEQIEVTQNAANLIRR
jgi:hypothetical protein